MQRYLTPETQIEVNGQLCRRDVRLEVHEQALWLRTHFNRTPNVVELSEDAYLVLYMQECEMRDAMGLPVPLDIDRQEGVPIRRVPGQGIIRVLIEDIRPSQ